METSEKNNCLNPYLAGFLIGLTLIASYLVLGAGIGASNGLARMAAWCGMYVNPEHILGSSYFGNWGDRPLNYYLVYMLGGIFAGGFFSALTSGRIRVKTERGAAYPAGKRLFIALAGGILIGFASRLSRGCTSGTGLSGLAVLNSGGFVFLFATIVAGYSVAWLFRRQWND